MRRAAPLLLVVIVPVVLAGCLSRGRSRCERACAREAECAEKLELKDNDQGECVDACTTLERDPATQPLVERHVRCVSEAASCQAVVGCE